MGANNADFNGQGISFPILTESQAIEQSRARTDRPSAAPKAADENAQRPTASLEQINPTRAKALYQTSSRAGTAVRSRAARELTTPVPVQGPMAPVPSTGMEPGDVKFGGGFIKDPRTNSQWESGTPEDRSRRAELSRGMGADSQTDEEGFVRPANRIFESPEDRKEREAKETRGMLVRNVAGEVMDLNTAEGVSKHFDVKQSQRANAAAKSAMDMLRSSGVGSANSGEDSLDAALNSVGKPKKKQEDGTKATWNTLKAIHGVLRSHFDNLNTTLAKRADQHDAAAAMVAKVDPNHPAVQIFKDLANSTRSSIGERSLPEKLRVDNQLVEVSSELNQMKALNPDGTVSGKFREDIGPDRLNDGLRRTHRLLTGVVKHLQEGPHSAIGIYSPVNPDQLASVGASIGASKTTAKHPGHTRDIPRDFDEVTNSTAKRGHTWVGTRQPGGNLEQLEDTRENLKFLEMQYGKQSQSYQRMKARWNSAKPRPVGTIKGANVTTRVVPRGTTVPVVEPGMGGHVYTGKTEVTKQDQKVITPGLAPRVSTGMKTTAKSQGRAASVRAKKQEVVSSTAESAANLDKLEGHLRAGTVAPQELRDAVGVEGVKAVLARMQAKPQGSVK